MSDTAPPTTPGPWHHVGRRQTAGLDGDNLAVDDPSTTETIAIGLGSLAWTLPQPVGVTVHVVPWSPPLSLLCRSVAPALAAGNTVVVKPAERTPLTALRLAELVTAAGYPTGTVDDVASQVFTGFTANSGRCCDAGTRVLVEHAAAAGLDALRWVCDHDLPAPNHLEVA